MRVLGVSPYRQQPSYCGPACLKMVLQYYGIEVSEHRLGKLAGTTVRHGTSPEKLAEAARCMGMDARIYEGASVADIARHLTRDIPVIVNWFSTDEGHYSVAVGVDKENICLQDPEIGGLRTLRLEDFKRVWFDYSGPYPQDDEFRSRLMLVVTPKR